jgi:hypothetical protein
LILAGVEGTLGNNGRDKAVRAARSKILAAKPGHVGFAQEPKGKCGRAQYRGRASFLVGEGR